MVELTKAQHADLEDIWKIIKQAILWRKQEGSNQWQDGYPNLTTITNDIDHQWGYLAWHNNKIIGYLAIILSKEPAYEMLQGNWLSPQGTAYMVIHRVAVTAQAKGKGFAHQILQQAENIGKMHNIQSIKIDTNFDNYAMLKVLEKGSYTHCGTIYFRGVARMAFEKLLYPI